MSSRRADPAQRIFLHEGVLQTGQRHFVGSHRAAGQSRRDGIDAHTLGAELVREAAHQRVARGFGRDVGGVIVEQGIRGGR
jgi:hypothetical protein